MQHLKFGLVFDLNFFHQLDLCQVNKTLLKRIFTVFSNFLFFLFLSTLNLDYRLKSS